MTTTSPSTTGVYAIHRALTPPRLDLFDQDPAWAAAAPADIASAHPRSSDHHPRTQARILYDATSLYVHFIVHDRYVRSIQREFNSSVCTDSCVEFFVEPTPAGYFNFEINAGGTVLCSYIRDSRRVPGGFVDYTPLPPELLRRVQIRHSLPAVVDPEIAEVITWQIAYRIPLELMEQYCGRLSISRGTTWRGNLYKCADQTSHPHWLSWQPIGEPLNFHLPERFGSLAFQG